MDRKVGKKWIKGLRSNEYNQCTGALGRVRANGEDAFCCLGVLQVVQGIEAVEQNKRFYRGAVLSFGRKTSVPTHKNAFGLSTSEMAFLTSLNDHRRWSFTRIADYIEETLLD